jgi:hypothetical protein
MVTEKEVITIADETAKEMGYIPVGWGRVEVSFPLSKFRQYSREGDMTVDWKIFYNRLYRKKTKDDIELRSMQISAVIRTPALGEIGEDVKNELVKQYHVAELWEGSPNMKYTSKRHVLANFSKLNNGVKGREIIPKAIRAIVYFMEDYEATVRGVMEDLRGYLPVARPITKSK